MDENGNIESGPCSSRETSFCAALLWNDKYALKANNVIVTLDYAVKCTDDMNVFSQMSSVLRAKVLREKYDFFTSKGMGFLMPFRTTLCGNGAGCYGVNPWVYSPDSHAFWPVSSDNHHPFSCDDEDAINSILNGTNTCGSGVISGCKVCKADGSGWVDDNSRCASGQVCSSGVCVSACVAKTCSSLNYSCGFASDGCGYNTLNCGICEPGQICNGGICKSNGGGGGGNPNPPVQPVVTKSITKMTRAEILAAIAQIQALIADLKKQLAALGGPMATFSCTQITKNLFYGTKNDPQVKCLQEVLKSRGYVVAVSGNYDAATRTAVAQFQQKYASEILALYHLTRGSGNVGNATREKINLFINKK
jgi:hypothetical protein